MDPLWSICRCTCNAYLYSFFTSVEKDFLLTMSVHVPFSILPCTWTHLDVGKSTEQKKDGKLVLAKCQAQQVITFPVFRQAYSSPHITELGNVELLLQVILAVVLVADHHPESCHWTPCVLPSFHVSKFFMKNDFLALWEGMQAWKGQGAIRYAWQLLP